MLRNKEIKKLLLIEIFIFLFFLVVGIGIYHKTYTYFENQRIKEHAYILSSLVSTHPELEVEIIQAMENYSGDFEEGKSILQKYNLDEIEGISDLESTNQNKKDYYLTHFTLITIMFLSISGVYYLFTHHQYKKIRLMNRYLDNVLTGKENFDIRDYEEGDFSALKNDIYKITTILREQTKNAKKDKIELANTLSDISHQIKTPLTSMYVINDLLLDDKIEENKKKELLNQNRHQLEKIEWLVTSLLKVSRLDSGMVTLKMKKVNIPFLLKQMVEPLQIPMELKKQELIIKGDPNLTITVDPEWTIEALLNIVKNAHEHTKEGGKVEIEYEDNPLYTVFFIKDNGVGIKKEDLPHIFERFYKSAHSSKNSIGIGLNMAKTIIQKEHGEIHVKSEENVGTVFEIKFYKTVV